MKILSIETSCDDTGISIIEAKGGIQDASFSILGDNSNSQIKIHIPYGGVYPMLAKREHTKNLPILFKQTLKEAKLDKKNIVSPVDAVAVTYGPGLEIALWAGITFAKELANKWNVPLIPVNHMEGHIVSVFGKNEKGRKNKFKIKKVKTPILSLLVSGGHTQLVLSKKWMSYEIIGETMDDAVGEAFDKVARMLGLPYPGGPEISRLALEARARRERSMSEALEPRLANFQKKIMRAESASRSSFHLPRPMLHSKNLNFSFSGLKTAVLYLIRDIAPPGKISKKQKAEIALEFENAAIECLTHKTAQAIERYKIKTLIVSGGVAANSHLKNEIIKISQKKSTQTKPKKKIKVYFPTRELSGDNSLMIGMAGYLNYVKYYKKYYSKNKKNFPLLESIKATGNLRLG